MRIYSLFLVFCLCLCQSADAQDKAYRSFTIKDGLPTNNIFKIKFDHQGFLWIAHDKGISKYDGYTFKHYSHKEQKSTVYTDLYIAPDGKIWMTNLGLQAFYIENDEMILFRSFNIHFLHSTLNMGFLSNGNIIFNAEGTLFEYDLKLKKEHKLLHSFNIQYFQIYKDSVYFSHPISSKLFKYSNKKLDSFKLYANPLLVLFNEKAIVSSYPVTKSLDILHGLNYNQKTQIHLKYHYNHSEYRGGDLYVFTNGNVIKINIKNNSLKTTEVLSGHSYTHYAIDQLGNEWYSTLNDGIIFIPSSKIIDIEPDEKDRITKIVQFRKNVYGITHNNQLYYFKGDQPIKKADLSSTFHSFPIIVFKNLNDNFLLIGNSDFAFLDSNLNTIPYIKKLAMKDASLGNNCIYMATTGNVFHHEFDFRILKSLSTQESFNTSDTLIKRLNFTGRFVAVKYDTIQHDLYFGGIPGFFKKKHNGEISEIKDGIKKIFLNSIEHHDEFIIAGTIQSGVYILKNGQIIQHYSNSNSTIGNNINKIKINNNNIWILSEKGLHSISLKNFQIQTFSYIGAVDLNNCSDFTITDHYIYLVTSQKSYVANLRELRKKPPLIPMYFKYINNGDSIYYNLNNLNFHHNNNSIVVGIESPAASVLGFVEYEYSLNNTEWFRLNKGQNEIYLTQLSPGFYNIKIRQVGNSMEYQASFSISKPFWSNSWFYIFIGIALLSIIGLFYLNRVQHIRQKTQSEIEKFKLEKALQLNVLSSIRSQMNPHFIFNALNTIQSYIYLNDNKQAIGYLGKFSVLTRKILDESNRETISLADEIETLDLYIQLEQMRFENILEYEIILENIKQAETFKIPPMLIQPYVENAIKHGLLHKNQNRTLKINFNYSKEESILIAIIDDNGIGRKRSFEINKMKKSNHQSFSTRANKTRLDILNSHRRNPISVRIFDKVDEFNNSTGTTVQINIPIL